MDEPCILWNPIPEEANRYLALRVVQLGLAYYTHRDPLSLIVLAPWRLPGEEERDFAWRVSFRFIAGLRKQPVGSWAGGTNPPWPVSRQDQINGQIVPAMWEVTTSSFLDECIRPSEHRPWFSWHHYVIADYDASYEFVASDSTSKQLPGTWQDHRRYVNSDQWPGTTPWLPPEAADSEWNGP